MTIKLHEIKIEDFEISSNAQQRSIADEIEARVINKVKKYKNYKEPSGKKSTADFSIIENDKEIMIDVKSHNINSKMSMPNLISISKLDNIIKDDKKLFYNIISYEVIEKENHNEVKIVNNDIINIFELDCNKLSVGNLGNGQLQIKNLNKGNIKKIQDKNNFIKEYKELKKDFYNKQIKKFQTKLKILEGN